MTPRQRDFKDTAGKTILNVTRADDDTLIVTFDDETFSILYARRLYDDAEVETDHPFHPLDHRLDLVLEPAFGEHARPMHAAALQAEETKRAKRIAAAKAKRLEQFRELQNEFGK